ncbi:MAG: glycosyltransferase family 2 protein [Nanoarchaeota archaeon]|nr:glycosyltransferase family 2 protein [Nanoarchaeota archaeon]MBU0962498.1 glycosyltransferase family 2 protein [Nanoarchaeota archaeon]
MDLSIIVPAYNEEKRITNFLSELSLFGKNNLKDYEIVIVDDGSTDNTREVIKDFIKRDKKIRLVSYPKNKGKGYAIREGIFSSNGNKIIFIDADGSIRPDQIPLMLKELEQYDCVVGNRRDKDSQVTTSKYRDFTQRLFNSIVMILFNSKINDNLCGFKGFKKEVALDLFNELHDYGWIFDVEIFYKIQKKGYSLKRIPIVWKHVGDSKMKPLDPVWMFIKLLKILQYRIPTLFEKNDKNR